MTFTWICGKDADWLERDWGYVQDGHTNQVAALDKYRKSPVGCGRMRAGYRDSGALLTTFIYNTCFQNNSQLQHEVKLILPWAKRDISQ